MSNNVSHKDMVAVLTGSTSGFGKEVAKLLASKGAKVVISGRREQEGLQVVKECNDLAVANGGSGESGNAIFVQTDVTSDASCRNLFEQAKATFGKVTHAFLNAGILPGGSFVTDDGITELENLINTNIKGTTLSARYAYRAIGDHGEGGAVVFTSSVGGTMSNASGLDVLPPGNSVFCLYTATKSYIDSLVRGCVTFDAQGIRTYAISPSVYISGMNNNEGSDEFSNIVNPVIKDYSGDPKDVAQVVVSLFDGTSKWKQGSNVCCEGPYTYDVHERCKLMYEPGNYGIPSPPVPLEALRDLEGNKVTVTTEDLENIVQAYKASKDSTAKESPTEESPAESPILTQ